LFARPLKSMLTFESDEAAAKAAEMMEAIRQAESSCTPRQERHGC
jgi:hypothetical protein